MSFILIFLLFVRKVTGIKKKCYDINILRSNFEKRMEKMIF